MCPIVAEGAGCVATGSLVGGSTGESQVVERDYNCPRAETGDMILEAGSGLVCMHMDLQDR